MLSQDHPCGLSTCLFGDDSDFIDFEIILSTNQEQIAIAPGYLQKSWEENGRKYFHYKMDKPMANFYSMVSAQYAVKQDIWTKPEGEEVNLEIYHHPAHDHNIDRMMDAMKASLTYYTQNFSPFQFRQLRIMEFPRYRSFAQSFANTVPFSEGVGFMQDPKKGDVDFTFYITDFIGEENVNAALRDYIEEFAFKEAPYPTTTDLIGYFETYTPDSLQYLITDLFETITLFENRTETGTYKQLEENNYEVSLTVNAKKYRADELGKETEIDFNDWIDIGVYGENMSGEDSLLYLKKHKVVPGEQTINIQVSKEPVRAGIDPLNIMIDRNPSDNVIAVDSE